MVSEVEFRIETDRLILRPWRSIDLATFSSMHFDPEVQADQQVFTADEAQDKLRRYQRIFVKLGYTPWAMTDKCGYFLGYVGMQPIALDHPLGPGVGIGWRLTREAWGKGFATEGATAALDDGFSRLGFEEVLSFTSPENLRSQAVIVRLGLQRRSDLDFLGHDTPQGPWRGLVWSARRTNGRH